MKTTLLTTIPLVVALVISGCASNAYADGTYDYYNKGKVVQKIETSIGEVFANKKGLTLYTFTKDSKDTSNCYNNCAVNWPPFTAKKGAKEWGAFTVIERKDGTYQWAHNHQPLYTWVGDKKAGDTYGEGVGSVWYALKTK